MMRRTIAAVFVVVAIGGLTVDLAAQDKEAAKATVLVVSRERVLRETEAGQALRAAERDRRVEFEASVDAVKALLEAEEAELAQQRGSLSRAEFDRRAKDFDRRVRNARRLSQRQAAELQRTFRLAREALVAELAPILIEILRSEGASLVLDTEQILIAAPSVDMTDKVIELFNDRVPLPVFTLPPLDPLLSEPQVLDADPLQSNEALGTD
ncbi:MAG: OmpH family outer membrane protein [Pseudomonadota bacterium]